MLRGARLPGDCFLSKMPKEVNWQLREMFLHCDLPIVLDRAERVTGAGDAAVEMAHTDQNGL